MLLGKVLPIVLSAVATVVQRPLERSKVLIKTLKRFGWEPEHPPAEFSDIYAYTLVEYALASRLWYLFLDSSNQLLMHQLQQTH